VVIRLMSTSVIARVNFMACGVNTREGASPRPPVLAATGPAWPSWMLAAAPCSCMTSANRRSPGTASSRTMISPGAPWPSVDTAQ